MNFKLTEAELDAARSPKGGWTAKTLKEWGVSWPPPHGWKAALLNGDPIPPPVGNRQHVHAAKRFPPTLSRLAADLGVSESALQEVLLDLVKSRKN